MVSIHSPWQPLPPLPEPNGGFVFGRVDDEVVIAGGTNWEGGTKRWLDRIWAYHPGRNHWRDAGRIEAPLAYAATGHTGRTLWFASGTTGTETHRSLWTFDRGPVLRKTAELPLGFVYAGGGIIGDTLYAIGGSDDQARLDRMTNAVFGIDLGSGRVTRLADHPEPNLFVGGAAACGNRVLVFGGSSWDPNSGQLVDRASAHAYSPETNRWEKLPPLPAANRGLTVLALDARYVFIGGGYCGPEIGFTDLALIFDLVENRYHGAVTLPLKGMTGLVQAGDWLYCLGGEDRQRHRAAEVFRVRWRELLPP